MRPALAVSIKSDSHTLRRAAKQHHARKVDSITARPHHGPRAAAMIRAARIATTSLP